MLVFAQPGVIFRSGLDRGHHKWRSQEATAAVRVQGCVFCHPQELEHTSATLAALDASEGTLKDAHGAYGGQRHKIRQSHALLSKMQRASLVDRLTLYGGAGQPALTALGVPLPECMH